MRRLIALAVLAAASGTVQAQIQQPSSPSGAIWEQHKVLTCAIKDEARPIQLDFERKTVCFIGNSGACRTTLPFGTMKPAADGGIEIEVFVVDGADRVEFLVYVSRSGDVLRWKATKTGVRETRLAEGSCKAAS